MISDLDGSLGALTSQCKTQTADFLTESCYTVTKVCSLQSAFYPCPAVFILRLLCSLQSVFYTVARLTACDVQASLVFAQHPAWFYCVSKPTKNLKNTRTAAS